MKGEFPPWIYGINKTKFQIRGIKYLAGDVGYFLVNLQVNEPSLEYITSFHFDVKSGLRICTPFKGSTNLFQERVFVSKHGRDISDNLSMLPIEMKRALTRLGFPDKVAV